MISSIKYLTQSQTQHKYSKYKQKIKAIGIMLNDDFKDETFKNYINLDQKHRYKKILYSLNKEQKGEAND